MIKIKRGEAPEVFTKKNGAAHKERVKAELWYSQEPMPEKAFDFTFYTRNKNKYKGKLIDTFHGRCAYCECYVMVSNRGDIEHFRPKSKYTMRNGTDSVHGYYWLAADWENLYLSCTNCNQSTTFSILDTDDPTKVICKTAGKMTQFALSDEKYRRDRHTLAVNEEEPYRLLIDPCKDDPETLLEFMSNGVLRPRQPAGLGNDKARYSIDVYVLQRDVLVRARREKYLLAMDRIKSVSKLFGYVAADLTAGVVSTRHEEDKEQLAGDFSLLLDMLDVGKVPNEYVGVARQFIHPFLNEYATKVSDLLGSANGAAWYGTAVACFRPQMEKFKAYFDGLSGF